MKPIKFKFLLLLAVMAFACTPFIDANIIQPVTQFIQGVSPGDMGLSVASLAVVPLSVYIKENSTLSPTLIEEMTVKFGKIKILTVVIEPPIYDENGTLTDKGEFYQFVVKRPDLGTVRMLMNYAKQGKTDEYLAAFRKNLVVGGDEKTLDSDGIVYLGFATKVDEFLKPYESFLANA